jgi:hypothetical protein
MFVGEMPRDGRGRAAGSLGSRRARSISTTLASERSVGATHGTARGRAEGITSTTAERLVSRRQRRAGASVRQRRRGAPRVEAILCGHEGVLPTATMGRRIRIADRDRARTAVAYLDRGGHAQSTRHEPAIRPRVQASRDPTPSRWQWRARQTVGVARGDREVGARAPDSRRLAMKGHAVGCRRFEGRLAAHAR